MKLSKSKLALAKVINENGGWSDDSGGEFAAQCTNGDISFWRSKPSKSKGGEWCGYGYTGFQYEIKNLPMIQNWHQTCLSREEYYQAYPEVIEQDVVDLAEAVNMIDGGDKPKVDADGWIEWKGGECPVGQFIIVEVRYRDYFNGVNHIGDARVYDWNYHGSHTDIVAYRLHKPEVNPEFCESVMRSIPEPEADGARSRLDDALAIVKAAAPHLLSDKYKFEGDEVLGEQKPTIQQLAQDYRNKLDFANRKLDEAETASSAASSALSLLRSACKEFGLDVSPSVDAKDKLKSILKS